MLIGLGLFIAGLVYGVIFVNIPYQDPSQEVYDRWLFHVQVTDYMLVLGLSIFAAGFLAACAKRWIGS